MVVAQMSGPNAYANCCAPYNDCAPSSIQSFTNLLDFVSLAKTLIEENKMRKEHADHFEYGIEI